MTHPHENPSEHVKKQIESNAPDLHLEREHVVKLAKDKAEQLKLKHVVHKENVEKRRKLAAKIEQHKKDSEHELSDAEEKEVDSLATELKAETVNVQPKGFMDTAMEKFDEYSQKILNFVTPIFERLQNFFAGATGKLWTMMGLSIPDWAKPDAVELRDLKAIFREEEFAKIAFERNPKPEEDAKKMTELREIFLNADQSVVPANMQAFMRVVVREALKLKGPSANSLMMQDLVDAARRTYKVAKKPEEKKPEEKKPEEKPKENK